MRCAATAAKYQDIANQLRTDIASGAWAVGDQLPTEADLMQRHDSSHERRALDLEGGPLLTVRRTTWAGERVVEINHMKMPGDSYELRYGWDVD